MIISIQHGRATSLLRLRSTALLLPIFILLAGCSSGGETAGQCESAFEEMTPIEPVEGLYILVSDDLAQTLKSCDTIAEWAGALKLRPEKVGSQEILEDEIFGYVAGACDILPNDGAGNSVCDEAYERGIFQPSGTP